MGCSKKWVIIVFGFGFFFDENENVLLFEEIELNHSFIHSHLFEKTHWKTFGGGLMNKMEGG